MNRFVLLLLLVGFQASAQHFTRKDSLRGSLRTERTCFDVQRYDLNLRIDPGQRSIVGYNDISFKVIENTRRIQIDLFANMSVDSIVFGTQKLAYHREFDAVFIDFDHSLEKNTLQKIRFYYSGKPIVAARAPWDGGFVFSDDDGKPWIGVAVQGIGASLWYPVKDTQTDEPDQGASIKVAVPNGLMNVSNGRFLGSEDLNDGYTRWDWEVKNPINTYDITVNIADYVHLHDQHNGLDLDYYVLRRNEQKAKAHFEEVKPMMDCFQSKFGPYPFANDGYKLVETPYLGMEHQSAVAYGNRFLKGYMGNDLSGTGVGLLFDFITIHESGHEWFGNSITSADVADMWIHEGFTCYSESVFLECNFGKEKAYTYINGLKRNVDNDKPIIGQYGVCNEGSGDMYYKGALMLHTIRHIINDDQKWWKLILDFSNTFKHQIIVHQTVVDFFNAQTGLDLTPVFDQYLRHKNIPTFEWRIKSKKLEYRWVADVSNFDMPVDVIVNGKTVRLKPTTQWQRSAIKVRKKADVAVAVDRFFVNTAH
ncbi:M1 family metallopeptidase [Flavobacterium caeni]|uniref:Peptidase family M1 n=1 Tax=Flavobacterium caeni TaxID=490189 RepID=A0A1G5JQB7_9FLAO|nr:M1 family metallopeptidase [Flavobacterium caeni]SCY90111.1 Peptidase family M1 [Flavobacterium caeni]